MADFVNLGFAFAAAGSALYGATRAFGDRRRLRAALRVPVLDAATPEGTLARITGIARAIDPLTAPLSGAPCVAYRARVSTANFLLAGYGYGTASGDRETAVVTPFVVDRGAAGTVLVDGTHAELGARLRKIRGRDRTRREQFLLAAAVPLKERFRAKFLEACIPDGARVEVAGLVMHDPAAEPDTEERAFRDAPAPALRLTGNFDHPLAITVAKGR